MKHLDEYINEITQPNGLDAATLRRKATDLVIMGAYLRNIEFSMIQGAFAPQVHLDLPMVIESDLEAMRDKLKDHADYLMSQASFFNDLADDADEDEQLDMAHNESLRGAQ